MDREELLALAEQWDRWACLLAVRCLRRFRGRASLDLDDLCAAARLGLWKAALRFDPGRGVKFGTYAAYAIRAELQECVEPEVARGLGMTARERAKCRLRTVIRFSESEPGISEQGEQAIPPADWIPDREHPESPPDLSGLWDRIRPLLTEQEYAALVERYRGEKTHSAIAAALGVKRQRVHQIVCGGLAKLSRRAPELAELID